MLRITKGSIFLEIPNGRTTAKKCEYIFLTAHTLFPSGVSVEATMYENEEAYLNGFQVCAMGLGNYEIDIRNVDFYQMLHNEGLKFFPDFEICKSPKREEIPAYEAELLKDDSSAELIKFRTVKREESLANEH